MSKKIEKPKQRLSSDARRESILAAAVPVFAEVGFRAATTKRLAAQVGISEALLYQHFPSKEALYTAVQDRMFRIYPDLRDALGKVPPSTEHLIFILYVLATMIIDPPEDFDIGKVFPRVILQSMLDDGEFARMHFDRNMRPLTQVVARSIDVARATGDLVDGGDDISNELRFWMAHHVLIMIHLGRLPSRPIHDHYPKDKDKLVDQALKFMMRGMGLTETAVSRYYETKRLKAALKAFIEKEVETGGS